MTFDPTERKWRFYKSVVSYEELLINGLNLWEHEWRSLGYSIHVKDPLYQQDHSMDVYEITDGMGTVLFAAGEFSNNVWGIYLPVD
ncbi:hypothetical protein [Mucilaginibacter sp. HD30]